MDSSIPSGPDPTGDELNGVLREVVEHIRATPAPSELTALAIERAAALSSDEAVAPIAQASRAESAPSRSKRRRFSAFAPAAFGRYVARLVAFFSMWAFLSKEKPESMEIAQLKFQREAAPEVRMFNLASRFVPNLDTEHRTTSAHSLPFRVLTQTPFRILTKRSARSSKKTKTKPYFFSIRWLHPISKKMAPAA